MKATGIVRPVDPLGRVVIPKEIRRAMRIKEGDPLELYVDNDGSVTFKKYVAMGDKDFAKAKNILKAMLPNGANFALYDVYGDLHVATNMSLFAEERKIDTYEYIPDDVYEIKEDYEVIGYLYFKGDIEDSIKKMAVNVLTEFYKLD